MNQQSNDNQEPAFEYADIHMHLLAPKPETQTTENDDASAPLVYTDFARHDDQKALHTSQSSTGTKLSPTGKSENTAQLFEDEDDIGAMYHAMPIKKRKVCRKNNRNGNEHVQLFTSCVSNLQRRTKCNVGII